MENKIKISIIVPIYNKENFLHKCLGSLAAQSNNDFEVILIDDGSTDSSRDICLSYVASKPEVFSYFYSENKGVSYARNKGIELARGAYVGFTDSDDWVSCDFIQQFLVVLSGNDKDIVTCRMMGLEDEELFVINGDSADLSSYCNSNPRWRNSACNKLFNKEMLFKHDIKFITNCHASEDFAFTFCSYLVAKNVLDLTLILYYYNLNSESITKSVIPRKDLDKEIYMVIDGVYDFIKLNNLYRCANEPFNRAFVNDLLCRYMPRLIRERVLFYPQEFYALHERFIRYLNIYITSKYKFIKLLVFNESVWLIFRKLPVVILFLKRVKTKIKNYR